MYITQPRFLESRVQLGNEELVLSPLVFGTNWTRLRIGMRYNMASNSVATLASVGGDAGLAATPPIFFGLCAGKMGFTHASPTAVMGAMAQGWSVSVSGANSGYTSSSNIRLASKVGGVIDANTVLNSANLNMTRAPIKTVMMLDITKVYDASATPSVSLYALSGANLFIDQSQSAFHEALRTSTGTPTNYVASAAVSTTPLTATQVNTLDSICVWWWRSVPVMQIFNIAAVRIL